MEQILSGKTAKRYGGRFTSSKIHALTKLNSKKNDFGSPALTYIKEKKIELLLKDSVSSYAHSKRLAWGNFVEVFCYHKCLELDLGYILNSKETKLHPKYSEYWSGACDMEYYKGDKLHAISEIKCYQKKGFALYAEMLQKKDIELFKKEYPQEYWQIVSNACIHDVDFGEAIAFMPFKKDYDILRGMAENYEGVDAWKYRFIYEDKIWQLPFLNEDSSFNDIEKFMFEVPKEDKQFLTSQVEKAIKILK